MKRCDKHKKYQAKKKPTSTCEKCWRIWITIKDAQCDNCPQNGSYCSEYGCHLLPNYGKVSLE